MHYLSDQTIRVPMHTPGRHYGRSTLLVAQPSAHTHVEVALQHGLCNTQHLIPCMASLVPSCTSPLALNCSGQSARPGADLVMDRTPSFCAWKYQASPPWQSCKEPHGSRRPAVPLQSPLSTTKMALAAEPPARRQGMRGATLTPCSREGQHSMPVPPWPPTEGRQQKATPTRHSKETPWWARGSQAESSGPSSGGAEDPPCTWVKLILHHWGQLSCFYQL